MVEGLMNLDCDDLDELGTILFQTLDQSRLMKLISDWAKTAMAVSKCQNQ